MAEVKILELIIQYDKRNLKMFRHLAETFDHRTMLGKEVSCVVMSRMMLLLPWKEIIVSYVSTD